jgi:hypothetical protein
MRTFRKYKRRVDCFETNRVKMSRQRLRQMLPELKRLNRLKEKTDGIIQGPATVRSSTACVNTLKIY